MLKFNVKFFSQEKTFKVTFSGIDKFLSNRDIENSMERINELKILRVNKSPNKNFCHLEISSLLSDQGLRAKLENFKILGKSVKVRIKEFDEEMDTRVKLNYTEYDQSLISDIGTTLTVLKETSNNFYIKNLSSNLVNVKALAGQIDTIPIEIKTVKPILYDFEYKININTKNKLDKAFATVRDSKDFIDNEDNKISIEFMDIIKEKLLKIFTKLNYRSYDYIKKTGVLKEIQIRYSDSQYLLTIMLSQEELTNNDFICIREAINYEFKEYTNLLIYLAVNDKINARFHNSAYYQHILGTSSYLNIKDLHIYPFDSDIIAYLNDMSLHKELNIDTIVDKTSNYVPYTSLMSKESVVYFNNKKYGFELYDLMNKRVLIGDTLLSCPDRLIQQYNDETAFGDRSLFVLNLKDYTAKARFLRKIRYHLLLSNSFSQILDFLRNYPSDGIRYHNITFIRKGIYEIDDILLALEIV
jgi:hypothetical protein